MKEIIDQISQMDHEALFDELERRYGGAVAQEIIDQIRKVEADTKSPDYMMVKACSEMLELFRGEAKSIVARIRTIRRILANAGPNVLSIEERRLEKEFKRIYRLYWISMKLFYPLFDQAMAEAQTPPYSTPVSSPQSSGVPFRRAVAS